MAAVQRILDVNIASLTLVELIMISTIILFSVSSILVYFALLMRWRASRRVHQKLEIPNDLKEFFSTPDHHHK